MAYETLSDATTGETTKTSWGNQVKSNQEDHEARIGAVEDNPNAPSHERTVFVSDTSSSDGVVFGTYTFPSNINYINIDVIGTGVQAHSDENRGSAPGFWTIRKSDMAIRGGRVGEKDSVGSDNRPNYTVLGSLYVQKGADVSVVATINSGNKSVSFAKNAGGYGGAIVCIKGYV